MPEPFTTAVISSILGKKALDLIEDTVKDHVKSHLAQLLPKVELQALEDSEIDALESAYANVLAHAYQRALQALGNVLNPVVQSGEEWARYRNPVEEFLNNRVVTKHLLETVRDLSNNRLPDPRLLEREWLSSGGFEFPDIPYAWDMVATYFRTGARDRAFVTAELREVLMAQNLDAIRELGEKLVGVQISVKQEQYSNLMQKRYAAVELANVAPAYTEDPGVLVVSDVFEPQHVRENPPPVEITKEELEKLSGKSGDGAEDAELIALLDELDEDAGQNVTERLKFQRSSYAEQPVRPVLDVVCRKENRLIVFTGEPGAGKSILMRYLLLGVLSPPLNKESHNWTHAFVPVPDAATPTEPHFPLLIELRDYYFTCRDEPGVNSFLDYVDYLGETQGYAINREWLHQRLLDGPSLLLFDGLDEIFDKGDRDEIMKQIVGVTMDYPKARVIVTSRPHGYHEGILRPAGFAHFRLQDLDRDQKESFARGWFARVFPNSEKDAEQRIERVLGSVDRSPSVRWLAGNPLLLTIMCLIAREKELPRERARFYEQCIDVLVHHWQINKHLREQDQTSSKAVALLDEEDKKDLLRRIAFRMQGSQAGLRGNFIGERELLELTQSWFEDTFPDVVGVEAREAARLMVTGLWEQNYLLCPRGPKLYGFLHRTFMEFLTATEYVRRFQKTPDFELSDLDAVFREHGNDPEWSEVLRLICGEIGDEFADPLIRTLLTLKEFPTKSLNEKNQPNHLVLGIRCMSELRGLSKREELGQHAFDICIEFLKRLHTEEYDEPFMLVEFLQAASEIGTRWPRLVDQTPEFAPSEFKDAGLEYYPEFHAAVVRSRASITDVAAIRSSATHAAAWRVSGLRALSKWWGDQSTHKLLMQRTVKDKGWRPRATALELLVQNERWADESTHELLMQRAVKDKAWQPRAKAMELLVRNERWADESTHELLMQRALKDKHEQPRAKALELLVQNERWADQSIHELLMQCAVNDEHGLPRAKALELLAADERWADETTRQLLSQRAVNDEAGLPRAKALELLAGVEQWADHEDSIAARNQFIADISAADSPEQRGAYAYFWFDSVQTPDPLSDAKKQVFTRYPTQRFPYLDPREPVSDDHLSRIAIYAGLDDAQLAEMVEQMNETLGWDIRKGWPGPTDNER